MSLVAKDCPYLKRVGKKVGYAIEAYCHCPSVCGFHVPSSGEFFQFCTSGDHHRCPVYRFAMEASELEVEEELKGWEERLREIQFSSLQVEGEMQERYQEVLRALTAEVEALRFRWQQIKERKLRASGEEWQRMVEAIEALEWAYERVLR